MANVSGRCRRHPPRCPNLACAGWRATCHGRRARRAALLRRPVPRDRGWARSPLRTTGIGPRSGPRRHPSSREGAAQQPALPLGWRLPGADRWDRMPGGMVRPRWWASMVASGDAVSRGRNAPSLGKYLIVRQLRRAAPGRDHSNGNADAATTDPRPPRCKFRAEGPRARRP